MPGGKVGLAQLVYDETLMGDAAATPMSERSQLTALIASDDPRFKLRGYAVVNGEVWQRPAPVLVMLRDAAAPDTDTERPLRILVEQGEERRRVGARKCAESIADTGALTVGLTPQRAADRLFALASLEAYLNLSRVCGWTTEEYVDWPAEAMIASVLEAQELTVGGQGRGGDGPGPMTRHPSCGAKRSDGGRILLRQPSDGGKRHPGSAHPGTSTSPSLTTSHRAATTKCQWSPGG